MTAEELKEQLAECGVNFNTELGRVFESLLYHLIQGTDPEVENLTPPERVFSLGFCSGVSAMSILTRERPTIH